MTGCEKLEKDVRMDCEERGMFGCGCFNPEGCNRPGARIGNYGEPGYKECSHRYCDKFAWIISRAKHYAEFCGVPWESVLDAWEEKRDYWYMNYYQDCNQPLLDEPGISIFDTREDVCRSVGEKGFRCPNCGKVQASSCKCAACGWKVYGLLGDLRKGARVFIKEEMKVISIFMPVAWEPGGY